MVRSVTSVFGSSYVLRDRALRVPLIWALALILYSVLIYTDVVSGRAALWLRDLTWAAASAVAAIATWRTSRQLSGKRRTAWTLFADAFASRRGRRRREARRRRDPRGGLPALQARRGRPRVKAAWGRILVKLSGEHLAGERGYGISPTVIAGVAKDLRAVHELGVQLAVVIGGGNVIRGMQAAAQGMQRASADYMGMLATVINALAMQNALEQVDVPTRVLSVIPMATVCEPYIRRRAIRHLEKGRVVVFAAGTGNPFFTTDKEPGAQPTVSAAGSHRRPRRRQFPAAAHPPRSVPELRILAKWSGTGW